MRKRKISVAPKPISRSAVERMLAIHRAVQSGKFPNANTLSRELEVTSKSIHRDLIFMRDRLRLPLKYDELRFGYYYTRPVRGFPTLHLAEGELFAILIAEKTVQQYRGTAIEKPLMSAFRKMAAALPETVSLSLPDLDESISFRTSAEPIINVKVFDTLAQATAQHQQLRIVYRKPGAKPEERIIDPYHLANINGEWFVFAFDHLRNDLRTFVPSRMQSVARTGRKFVKPESFSLEKTLRDSFGVHSGEGYFDVVIQFDGEVADYIREKRWHASQRLRNLPRGGVELQLRLSSWREIERWVLSWGGHAMVVRPAELANSVRRAAQRILQASRSASPG
ncbi:MAG: WYL domain-containing protein, partial [Verrucomicrobia subdivision 3 bacterium]|nr:WYL domain-containing protein [Limisphaerales bacterium]